MKSEATRQGARSLVTVALDEGHEPLKKYSHLSLKINEHMKRPLEITWGHVKIKLAKVTLKSMIFNRYKLFALY